MIYRRTWKEEWPKPGAFPNQRWCTGWYLFNVIPLYVMKGAWT